jgi:tRNA pseudouridine38-40 synthase
LKLIVEDEDIVKKINDNLVPQIRVWGFERTNNAFSAYQMVDSRIYEYLIPTHSFLPPHPRSFMGRKCVEWAEKKGDLEQWKERQKEVEGYWEKVDEEMIRPILEDYDEEIRSILEKALYLHDGETEESSEKTNAAPPKISEGDADIVQPPAEPTNTTNGLHNDTETVQNNASEPAENPLAARRAVITEAMKRLRQAYLSAKRAYRIPQSRIDRISKSLSMYHGTKNYHNFTIEKSFKDPSAKRVIRSFDVNGTPIIINGTEWLSLKVHGQSFMMHQIRKMVGMVALVVRCGADPQLIFDALGPADISIPKAPALGLLLERPVFDNYNKKARELEKEKIDFDKFKSEMDEFKQKEIYDRMYRDEEEHNIFGSFFNHVDNFPERTFLYVTSGGIDATKEDLKTTGSVDLIGAGDDDTMDGNSAATKAAVDLFGEESKQQTTALPDAIDEDGSDPEDRDDDFGAEG